MCESPVAIPIGTQVEIELYAPVDCEKRTLRFMRTVAQVRWMSEIPEAFGYDGSNRCRVGAAFDEIDSEDRARLEEYVRGRLRMASAERIT